MIDFFIKKVFEGKSDELVHLQFQKFSRGKFEYKAMAKAKHSKGKYNVGTSYEFANELVRNTAEKVEGKTKVTGVIISTRKLKEMPEFSDLLADCKVKQFAGVRQYLIDMEISGEKLISLCDKLPTAVFALSFKSGDTELKIKTKAPKSGKPSSKGERKPEPDYCKIKTSDKELVKNLFFDVDINNFKLAETNHTFLIEDIIIPKDESDPAKMRELAIRKGKILRFTTVDGTTMKEEKEFAA